MSTEQEILGPDLVDHDVEHDYNSPFLRAFQQHYRNRQRMKPNEVKQDIFRPDVY